METASGFCDEIISILVNYRCFERSFARSIWRPVYLPSHSCSDNPRGMASCGLRSSVTSEVTEMTHFQIYTIMEQVKDKGPVRLMMYVWAAAPTVSYQGCAWEQLIRTVRRYLFYYIRQPVDDEMLLIGFAEVGKIVNDRPSVMSTLNPQDNRSLKTIHELLFNRIDQVNADEMM